MQGESKEGDGMGGNVEMRNRKKVEERPGGEKGEMRG